jgi:hypothetical protein
MQTLCHQENGYPSNCTPLALGTRRFKPDSYLITAYPSELIGSIMYVCGCPELRGRNDVELTLYSNCVIYIGVESSLPVLGLPNWMLDNENGNTKFIPVLNNDQLQKSDPKMLLFTHESENKDVCMLLYKKYIQVPKSKKSISVSLGSTNSQSKYVIFVQSIENENCNESDNHYEEEKYNFTKFENHFKLSQISQMPELVYNCCIESSPPGVKYVLTDWKEYGTNSERIPRKEKSSKQNLDLLQQTRQFGGIYNSFDVGSHPLPPPTFDGHNHSSDIPLAAVPKILRLHSHTGERPVHMNGEHEEQHNKKHTQICRHRVYSPRQKHLKEASEQMRLFLLRRKERKEVERCQILADEHGIPYQTQIKQPRNVAASSTNCEIYQVQIERPKRYTPSTFGSDAATVAASDNGYGGTGSQKISRNVFGSQETYDWRLIRYRRILPQRTDNSSSDDDNNDGNNNGTNFFLNSSRYGAQNTLPLLSSTVKEVSIDKFVEMLGYAEGMDQKEINSDKEDTVSSTTASINRFNFLPPTSTTASAFSFGSKSNDFLSNETKSNSTFEGSSNFSDTATSLSSGTSPFQLDSVHQPNIHDTEESTDFGGLNDLKETDFVFSLNNEAEDSQQFTFQGKTNTKQLNDE